MGYEELPKYAQFSRSGFKTQFAAPGDSWSRLSIHLRLSGLGESIFPPDASEYIVSAALAEVGHRLPGTRHPGNSKVCLSLIRT